MSTDAARVTEQWVRGFYFLISPPPGAVLHLEKEPMTQTLCGVKVEDDHVRGTVETVTDRQRTGWNFNDTDNRARRLAGGAGSTTRCMACFARAVELEEDHLTREFPN